MAVKASTASNMYYFLLFTSFVCVRAGTERPGLIKPGSSLTPFGDPWYSPSRQFAFGFYHQGNGFAVGVFMAKYNGTVVWTANRDDPPVSSNAKLQLTKDGKLVLETGDGQDGKLIANTTASSAFMFDSGNMVLHDSNSRVIWQSFDHPTDTILGDQILPTGGELVSSSSQTDHSSGRFRLKMQEDGNLVLYTAKTDDAPENAYWSSHTNGLNVHLHLYLNKTGPLLIRNSSSLETTKVLSSFSPSSDNTIFRATLDYDGVFRLYAHGDEYSGNNQGSSLWSAPDNENVCSVKGYCGFNSYCIYTNHQPSCNCIPGTDFVDQNQKTLGCKRNSVAEYCRSGKENAALHEKPSTMLNLIWDFRPYSVAVIPQEKCRLSCLEDCYCGVAFHQEGHCKKQQLPLRYVTWSSQNPPTSFFKSGKSLNNNTLSIPQPDQPPPIKTTSNTAIVQIILVILGFAFLFCSSIAVSSHIIYKIRVLRYKRLGEIGDLGLNEGLILRLFSYSELKRATNGFAQELGKGSFGAVYKGTLSRGRRAIAVKRLEKLVEEGEKEFQAEMRAIGKTHHRNLVRLLGYCAEGSKRLLVYEYMSNGSLGNLIFGDQRRPDWDERKRIALDVARGILYLHEGCGAPVIHCDIKPQNILMDEFWTAKISDFGLAKLLMPDQTRTFTMVRGTRGYLAPEWQKNTPITVKADVYSYGIMLLEIVFCRRNMLIDVPDPEKVVLSNWVYQCFARRELKKHVAGEDVNYTLLENMVKVGLWCIQDEPFLRPTMKSVVLMLEGVTDVAIPPCPSANFM